MLSDQRMQGLAFQFSQVEKAFTAASHKKAWDHFTKAQRKNIETWKKQAADIQNRHKSSASLFSDKYGDDEMDLSDSDVDSSCSQSKKIRLEESQKSIHQLREENDSLRCQLEAFKNEVDLIKADLKTELEAKDEQLKHLHEQLFKVSSELSKPKVLLSPTQSDTERATSQFQSSKVTEETQNVASGLETNCDSSTTQIDRTQFQKTVELLSPGRASIENNAEGEAKIIALISLFLHVHPFGASLDSIYTFAKQSIPTIDLTQTQSILLKYSTVFKKIGNTCDDSECNYNVKWTFIGI